MLVVSCEAFFVIVSIDVGRVFAVCSIMFCNIFVCRWNSIGYLVNGISMTLFLCWSWYTWVLYDWCILNIIFDRLLILAIVLLCTLTLLQADLVYSVDYVLWYGQLCPLSTSDNLLSV